MRGINSLLGVVIAVFYLAVVVGVFMLIWQPGSAALGLRLVASGAWGLIVILFTLFIIDEEIR